MRLVLFVIFSFVSASWTQVISDVQIRPLFPKCSKTLHWEKAISIDGYMPRSSMDLMKFKYKTVNFIQKDSKWTVEIWVYEPELKLGETYEQGFKCRESYKIAVVVDSLQIELNSVFAKLATYAGKEIISEAPCLDCVGMEIALSDTSGILRTIHAPAPFPKTEHPTTLWNIIGRIWPYATSLVK